MVSYTEVLIVTVDIGRYQFDFLPEVIWSGNSAINLSEAPYDFYFMAVTET